ncbi:hypothetical protein [Mangrovibacterium marinum]|uniref:Acetyltransferase (GNAT) family protein n=1 Tax=Mangrovibacterium marinum TaxID=1639118 RepID=A0A2T5C159_9BACT|nr:hypothetical protein [Mangrovibacterium marinum]PTN08339.1 hypothetical protein C8N47_10975 [Mangrovibacterium marinum]
MTDIQVNYLKYDEIDTDKWDTCVAKAPNSLVYVQSWYLDKLCPVWDALVVGDYQYVMPLTYRKKYGIRYLFQPLYCQQLGIFPTPGKQITAAFYQAALQHFSFGQIHLNAMNRPINEMAVEVRYNLLLNLKEPYRELAAHFSQHTVRKLKKASHNRLSFINGLAVKDYLAFKTEHSKYSLKKQEVEGLKQLLTFSLSRNRGELYGVYDRTNELCAAAFFVRHQKRVTFINAASSPLGRELGAMFFLLDHFIHLHAGKDYVLDFEGSMIDGVARMYKGFGASPETYYYLAWNNLPFWAKWLKR